MSAFKVRDVTREIKAAPSRRLSTSWRFARRKLRSSCRRALKSAIANAENNHNLRADKLVVKEAVAGRRSDDQAVHPEGPRQRRPDPQAERATSSFTVSDEIEIKQRALEAKGTKKSAAKKKTAKKAETSNE
jgi:large subunit ribosomal protein L22